MSLDHPGEGSKDQLKKVPVAPKAAPKCVTVAGAQWWCLVPRRWHRRALWRAILYDVINNMVSEIVLQTFNQEG
jgi:hypothetical protein